ncbi:MAG: D-aminoacyl-tRNA deacylase, partial [Actinobacteria bacterium]|nr:D-aminoacyl-tRNA deacylase [Actinomycetota bacterium]
MLVRTDKALARTAPDLADPHVSICRAHSFPPYLPVHVGRIEDTARGNRPSFARAARPEVAGPLYDRFCAALEGLGVPVELGVF